MKILINTSNKLIEINGIMFIPNEWVHVESDFIVPDYFDEQGNQIYPIKLAEEILDEKLSLIPDLAPLQVVETVVYEQNINGWVNGILEAGYGN